MQYTWSDVIFWGGALLCAYFVAFGVALLLLWLIGGGSFWLDESKRAVLLRRMRESGPRLVPDDFVGRTVVTKGALRPVGHLEIDGIRYEARTQGEFVQARSLVEVINTEGLVLVVRPVTETAESTPKQQ